MLDLYLILVPAVLIIIFVGLWVIRGMSPGSKIVGRLLIAVIATSVAGIITIAYVSSIMGLLMILVSIGYYLVKQHNRNKEHAD